MATGSIKSKNFTSYGTTITIANGWGPFTAEADGILVCSSYLALDIDGAEKVVVPSGDGGFYIRKGQKFRRAGSSNSSSLKLYPYPYDD